MSDAECGTYAGYQRHKKRGEEPDQFCRSANAEYRAEYRRKNPQTLVDQRRAAKRRLTALRILAVRHYREFANILANVR